MYDRRIKDETDTVLTHDTGPVSGKVEDLELSTLGNMMWRGRWVLLIALMVSVSLGAFYTFRVKIPLYTATTVIVMDAGGNDLMNRTLAVTGLTGDSEEVLTEVEIFQSRRLASKVVEELNLVDDPEFTTCCAGRGWLRVPRALSLVGSIRIGLL